MWLHTHLHAFRRHCASLRARTCLPASNDSCGSWCVPSCDFPWRSWSCYAWITHMMKINEPSVKGTIAREWMQNLHNLIHKGSVQSCILCSGISCLAVFILQPETVNLDSHTACACVWDTLACLQINDFISREKTIVFLLCLHDNVNRNHWKCIFLKTPAKMELFDNTVTQTPHRLMLHTNEEYAAFWKCYCWPKYMIVLCILRWTQQCNLTKWHKS